MCVRKKEVTLKKQSTSQRKEEGDSSNDLRICLTIPISFLFKSMSRQFSVELTLYIICNICLNLLDKKYI